MSTNSQDSDTSTNSDVLCGLDDKETENSGDDCLKLRKYQLELAENALLGKNTIICAGTGSGKTHVAMHIIQKHLDGAQKGTKKVVFMARTGALIKQQTDQLKRYLHQYEIRLIIGGEDTNKPINMLMECYDILCFTPQILVNGLEDKIVESLSQFSLLILDECHNTRGDEPYSSLMRKYLIEKYNGNKKLPQIVGLTASIGIGDARTIPEAKEYILRLCGRLDVTKLSTIKKTEKEYKKHIRSPEEETIRLITQTEDPCGNILRSAMEVTEDMLEDNALMQPDIVDLITCKQPKDKQSQEYNKWTVEVMKAAQVKVDDYNISRDIGTCAKYLNIYNSALEVRKLLRTTDIIKYLSEKHRQETEHKNKLTEMEADLYKNLNDVMKKLKLESKSTENPNVRILSDTLRKMIEDKGEESRAMVFVKTRATCKSLAAFLDDDLQSIDVKTSPLYGKETRAGDEGMTESKQTDVLEKFREGSYKILVCTSVGSEGIDIPACNIVLSYEYSGDEITKIQMKGRARTLEATTVTMGSEKIVEQERINVFKALMMHHALSEVEKLNEKQIELKIKPLQKEEIQKQQFKEKAMKIVKSNKTREDEYEILCKRCNTYACKVSDVRHIGNDHIAINSDFEDKIEKKVHNKPKNYGGISKKYKMYCKICPNDWGIIGIKDGLNLMTLQIRNLKFRNSRNGEVSEYKSWNDMPFDVQEIPFSDLPDLMNREKQDGKDLEDSQDKSTYKDDVESSDLETPTGRQVVDGQTGEASGQIQKCQLVAVSKDPIEHDGLEKQLNPITRQSDTDSALCLQTITDKNQVQPNTTKRKLDSDESSTQTATKSTIKEVKLAQPEQSKKESLTSDHECKNMMKQPGDTQNLSPKKRRKTTSTDNKEDDIDQGSESCISPLSSAGSSSGHLFKKAQDDTLTESMVLALSEQMKSVGVLIDSKGIVGTVFRVGSKYVMTAEHVVRHVVDRIGNITEESVYVCFDEYPLNLSRIPFRLNRMVFKSLDLDVAVLELSNSGNALPPKMVLSRDDAVTELQLSDVSFIGYGHPAKECTGKHLDPRCYLVLPSSRRLEIARQWLKQNEKYFQRALLTVGKDPKIVCKGYAGYDDSSKLLFDSFMQQGASGSPALTNNDSRSVKVVGILTHGLPEFYFLLPKIMETNVENIYRLEVGSKMNIIYGAIMQSNKKLADDLFE